MSDFSSVFKNKKALTEIVADNIEPVEIKRLKWSTNIIILLVIVITFLDYFLSVNEYSKIKENVKLINLS